MVGEERADFAPTMNRPAIPEQVDRAAEMAEQVLEKRSDVQAAEISWPAPEIQRHASPLRRDRHATADREAIMAIAVAHAGGLAAGHVRRTLGMSRKPLSSTKTRWAPRRAAFFYPWPILSRPAGDGPFVPLDGSTLRLLATPAQRGQHLPDVRGVIAHPELLADQFRDPGQCPKFCAVPGVERSLAQQGHQSALLGHGQAWRPAWDRLGVQPAGALALVRLPPAKDGTHGGPDLTGDGRQAPARLQQLNRASTALLQLLGGPGRSHEPSCRITPRIYAFFMQDSITTDSPVPTRSDVARAAADADGSRFS